MAKRVRGKRSTHRPGGQGPTRARKTADASTAAAEAVSEATAAAAPEAAIETIAAALHWATDSRDPFNSCHDYTSSFGRRSRIASYFGFKGGQMYRRNIYDGSEREAAWVQHHQCIKNSLTMCEYTTMPDLYYHPPKMDIRIFQSSLLSAVTGIDYSPDELWTAGERIWNAERQFLSRAGFSRKDDTLPLRVTHEPLPDGPAQGQVCHLEEMLEEYYQERGWDQDGLPTEAKLHELGLN